MSLRNGLDTIAIISLGVYSDTYVSSTGAGPIANLFISLGLLEDAPEPTAPAAIVKRIWDWFWEFF